MTNGLECDDPLKKPRDPHLHIQQAAHHANVVSDTSLSVSEVMPLARAPPWGRRGKNCESDGGENLLYMFSMTAEILLSWCICTLLSFMVLWYLSTLVFRYHGVVVFQEIPWYLGSFCIMVSYYLGVSLSRYCGILVGIVES